jgi:ribosomal protein S18 acetylase RimI-like enzyme
VIEISQGLSDSALVAIRLLEQRCIAVDGGRLKLEYGTLRSRPTDLVNDVLWWDGSTLVGFVGLYSFDGRNVELAGMVDPSMRRQRIATALLDAALTICNQRSYASILLVVPRNSAAGLTLAAQRTAVFDHSEHALVLTGPPSERVITATAEHNIVLRTATIDDTADVARILTSAFGEPPHNIEQMITEERSRTVVVETNGTVVGTVRLTREDETGGVYGFAVDPEFQGRGIGRDVLRRVCHQMRDEGATRIGLEVATVNESALGLYISLGFEPVSTEDYFTIRETHPSQP